MAETSMVPAGGREVQAVERLVAKTVFFNDQDIEAALAKLGRVRIDREARFPEDGPTYDIVRTVELPDDDEVLRRMAEILDMACTPMPASEIGVRIARLDMLTAGPNGSNDTKARVMAYADELRAYPADVAAEALSRTWHFFPSWQELKQVCERLYGPRRRIRAEIARRLQASEGFEW